MYDQSITTPISIFISIAALTGVSLHDTKLDKLTTTFVGMSSVAANVDNGSKNISNDPHTHVERVSLKDTKVAQPRLLPRHDTRKHLMQKHVPKGVHSHDGASQLFV